MRPIGALDNYIAAYRKRAGLSQSDLSILLGLSGRDAVANYETFRQVPSVDVLLALEMVLDEPVGRIFGALAEEVRADIPARARSLSIGTTNKPSPETAERLRTIDRLAHLLDEPWPWEIAA